MGHFRTSIHATLRRFGVDVYRLPSDHWLRAIPVQTVIDIGANTGQFAHIARELFPSSWIHSFEPLADCFHELTMSFRGDPRWRGYPFALGSNEGEATFHRSRSSASSSILTMAPLHALAFPETAGGWDEQVQVRRLDDVLRSEELSPDIILKIDVQGFEDRVLDGAMHVIERTRMVITEVSFEHLYEQQPLFDDIYSRLRHAGFTFRGTLGQLLHPKDGRVLQADAVFLRSTRIDPFNPALH